MMAQSIITSSPDVLSGAPVFAGTRVPVQALIDYLVPRLRRSFADAERIVVLIDTLALQQKRNISVELGAKALKLLDAERA